VKYLVLSDIHANLEALEATLEAAGPVDHTLVLGDLVGYGADPNGVVELVRSLSPAHVIRGNHDKVAAGLAGTDGFNHVARGAIDWTAAVLTPENRAWLGAIAAGPVIIDDTIEICHGTPFDEDVYIFDEIDALRSLRAAERRLCFFGHTHVPAIYRLNVGDDAGARGDAALHVVGPVRGTSYSLRLDDLSRHLVNCGAVGQPRDGDPRAAYGVVDTETGVVTIHRTDYDVHTARAKVLAAGLPDVLASRLALGR
jgi:diadenosine tetraphosphatase ApaH/serine/threonine PP2A family protein phosphatase